VIKISGVSGEKVSLYHRNLSIALLQCGMKFVKRFIPLNFYSVAFLDKCSEFLKAHHMDPYLNITPFKILTRMYGETMAATMAHFGSGFSDFFQSFQGM